MKKLTRALTHLANAKDIASAVLKSEYPVGSNIAWRKNGFHYGTVTLQGHGLRVRVRNEKTNKESWIDAHSIVNQ